ncbi:hypothetical protein CBL_11636 [Carabus blaptoides fortunei]
MHYPTECLEAKDVITPGALPMYISRRSQSPHVKLKATFTSRHFNSTDIAALALADWVAGDLCVSVPEPLLYFPMTGERQPMSEREPEPFVQTSKPKALPPMLVAAPAPPPAERNLYARLHSVRSQIYLDIGDVKLQTLNLSHKTLLTTTTETGEPKGVREYRAHGGLERRAPGNY